MGKFILVTGGQRSGKSEFAEEIALSLSEKPVYLATSHVYDEEMRQRVERHKSRRGDRWISVEEPLSIGSAAVFKGTVLIDCVTMWATNMFFEHGENVGKALDVMKAEIGRLLDGSDATYIFVTNEIGMGGTSDNPMQRKFTDLQGMINRYIAGRAEEVYLLISGISVKIKG